MRRHLIRRLIAQSPPMPIDRDPNHDQAKLRLFGFNYGSRGDRLKAVLRGNSVYCGLHAYAIAEAERLDRQYWAAMAPTLRAVMGERF